MQTVLLVVCGCLLLLMAALFTKIYLLKKAAKELEQGLRMRMTEETNTLIDISSNDKAMRKLATVINTELRELRKRRQRFEQGDQELKNAVTNISHDLRTPLTAIYGYLDLLEEEEKSETVERYLEVIRNRAGMLTQLTEELFRYSIVMSGENELTMEPVDVAAVLEESVAGFYTALQEQGIAPVIQMPEQKVVRTLDRAALSRIFSNLLNNAVKYSDGDLSITLSESGELVFTNSASGLDEVQVEKLFGRFYTVEAARHSTGLGLTIAKTLTEQIGGSIAATYRDGQLSICIVFPEENGIQ